MNRLEEINNLIDLKNKELEVLYTNVDTIDLQFKAIEEDYLEYGIVLLTSVRSIQEALNNLIGLINTIKDEINQLEQQAIIEEAKNNIDALSFGFGFGLDDNKEI